VRGPSAVRFHQNALSAKKRSAGHKGGTNTPFAYRQGSMRQVRVRDLIMKES